jgi:predicted Zn-dependent protease
MYLRTLVFGLALGLGVTSATAAPRKAATTYAQPKQNKKQQQIERHEWMAQYFIVQERNLKAAAKEYQAILRLDPKNLKASLSLSSVYLSDKQPKLAQTVLAQATKQNPNSSQAWLLLADMQSITGDNKGMKVSLAKVVALDPENATAAWMIFVEADIEALGGDADAKQAAVAAARRYMRLSYSQNSYSYKTAERAVVKYSGDPIALTVYDSKGAYFAAFDRGEIGYINTQMGKARRGFEACTKAQPSNEECHYYLGLVYSTVKSSDSYNAKNALGEFALAPKWPLAWVESARLLRANDQNDQAREALGKALALDSELPMAHVEMGILDKLDGKLDAAVEHFIAAMDADPFGAVGKRATNELSKAKPTHPRLALSAFETDAIDVFSTERYASVVKLIEADLGGVEAEAPERVVIDDIVRRLADGSAIKQRFKVQILASPEVNAFAMADGSVYVTRGMLDLVKTKMGKAIDVNNDALGHVLAHELSHVIRRHTLNSAVFRSAIKASGTELDRSVLTHVTRLQEMDADREGMVMAFLAGYHPRGGIEFMEAMGKEEEIPKLLDHPTFQERVDYLTDYWTNDVSFAFVSFKLGVAAEARGSKLEASDMAKAIEAYQEAVDDFGRFRAMLPTVKEAANNAGVANTKLGVLAMNKDDTALGRWQSKLSIERTSSVKYVNLARPEESGTRGGGSTRMPAQLREAIGAFKDALAIDETYSKARLNLTAAYIAAGQLDNANAMLAKVDASGGVTAGDIDLWRGIAAAEAKEYDKAIAAFARAVAAPSVKRAASYNLAKALQLGGKRVEAKKAYADYVKLWPEGPWGAAAKAAGDKL